MSSPPSSYESPIDREMREFKERIRAESLAKQTAWNKEICELKEKVKNWEQEMKEMKDDDNRKEEIKGHIGKALEDIEKRESDIWEEKQMEGICRGSPNFDA